MKTCLFTLILCCCLLAIIVSCDRPACTNTNSIFEQYLPDSKIYKDELAGQLRQIDQTKLSYWFQKYEAREGQEYLYYNIQGDGLCAVVVLTVSQWDRLENLRQKKGLSYIGAEFTDLDFDIEQDDLHTAFIYRDFGRIID